MRIDLLGGLRIQHDGRTSVVTGAMQLAVLFRLAVDAGSSVSYRAIAEDVWGMDAPENTRAALQSIISRLRAQLPAGSIESTVGGYRLAVAREDVDALVFADLVAEASALRDDGDTDGARLLADRALALWGGQPWVPSENFDWFERDLGRDHAAAVRLAVRPPASPDANHRRGSVPAPLTVLVGRENELTLIDAQLAASRLVTIVGTGGAGKTRLAIEAATHRADALLVELAPVGPGEVLAAIAAATGRELRSADATEPTGSRDRVLEALHAREVLLVLDNCEHLIDEVAALAQDLLATLPRLRILATSREPLSIAGEAFVAVGSLAHPGLAAIDAAVAAGELEPLLAFSAVELFRQRAVAACGTDLTAADIATAARITARLDGLPLAIELAAAKLRTIAPDEVLAGLEDRFSLLTGGFRSALPRHQTLRAMIDWSWSMLSADERTALTALSVFPAGVAASDVGLVASAFALASAAPFDSLVDRSLLQRSRGRYRALETIREYGIERLAESGGLADARTTQARYIASRAAEFDRLLRGPRTRDGIAWFDAEDDNISAALRFSTRSDLPDIAVALGTACAWYWVIRERQEDAQGWFAAMEPLAARVNSPEAHMVVLLAPILRAFGGADFGETPDSDDANRLREFVESQQGTIQGDGDLLQVLPPLLYAFVQAGRETGWVIRVKIPRGEDLGLGPWPTAILHVVRAALSQNRGDVDELGASAELAVHMFERNGDLWGLALAQQMRAEWLTLQGRLDEAFALTEASTMNRQQFASSWDLAQQQGLALTILIRQGRIAEARERSELMQAAANESGNALAILQTQIAAVAVDLASDDVEAAKTHLGRYDSLLGEWPSMPRQLGAWSDATRAAIALLDGDAEAAEAALRRAATSAIASQDHPVIANVALGLGTLALRRGDVREALRALDLSTAILGAYDATSPQVRLIEAAAADAGIGRASATAPTRPIAIETLGRLLA